MGNGTKIVELIVKLLRQTTSLAIVSDFLKSKGLTHSASSWDEMLNKRLHPAIQANALSVPELIELLRNAEEYGHQHVFLYHCKLDASSLMEKPRIEALLDRNGLKGLLHSPKVLDQPQEPTITDVRWRSLLPEKPYELTIKIIETRESQEFIGESIEGDLVTKIMAKNS